MKFQIDPHADALYLHILDSPVVDSREVSPGVVLDYNGNDELVGVEMLYLSKRNQKISDATLEISELIPDLMTVHEPAAPYRSGEKG